MEKNCDFEQWQNFYLDKDKLKSEMDKKQKLYDEYNKKTIEEIWLSEINEFETEYKKVHK